MMNAFNKQRNIFKKIDFSKKSGFTLIEMLISISLFTIVITIAFTALFSIMTANDRAKTIKLVVNNLSMSMESMTREIRVGSQYTCNASTPTPGGADCSAGNRIALKTDDGTNVVYAFNSVAKTIERTTSAGTVAILGSDIDIDNLDFYVTGAALGDIVQPRVLIVLKGSISRPNFDTEFNLQTTVSQRKLAP